MLDIFDREILVGALRFACCLCAISFGVRVAMVSVMIVMV